MEDATRKNKARNFLRNISYKTYKQATSWETLSVKNKRVVKFVSVRDGD